MPHGEGFSVFKPTGRKRYRIKFPFPVAGKRVHPGFRDKAATIAHARELLRRHERAEAGLADANADALRRPWAEVVAEYTAELARQGRGKAHLHDCRYLLGKVQEGTGWQSLAEVRVDQFRQYLQGMAQAGYSSRTQNHHRAKLRALLNWAVAQGWMAENPISRARLPALEVTRAKRKRLRRPLSPDELARLFAATPTAEDDGRSRNHRRLLYQVAAFSGFRRSELLRLVREDCSPHLARPRWHVDESRTKNGLAALLPMTPECAEALAPHWRRLPAGARLFKSAPNMATWRKDLKRAGIPYRDDRGRYADFHALRYTFAALVARQWPIEVVSKLMRHGSISLTNDVYLELGLDRSGEDAWVLTPLLPPPRPVGDHGQGDHPGQAKAG